jgi:hypothetical protein
VAGLLAYFTGGTNYFILLGDWIASRAIIRGDFKIAVNIFETNLI